VPNLIFATSPIPEGSCFVTSQFASRLRITGNETEDITVIISFSSNNSFEWWDNGGGIFDSQLDTVVDMGLRGMIPSVA
jgi:predicted outer membrane repeat protein